MPPVTARGPQVGRRVLAGVDRLCDLLALSALAATVLVVTWQVFGRYVLDASPRWAPELALVLLVWLSFLGIAIGARERSHIAVGFVVDRLPRRASAVVGRLAPLVLLGFGVYLVIQGWSFTQLTTRSTLPSTGLPSAVQYAAMPVSGVLIATYGALQLLGVDTRRGVAGDLDDDPGDKPGDKPDDGSATRPEGGHA